MSSNLESKSRGVIGDCSVCGRNTGLVELPERIDKFCFACSADLATAMLLSTEIDAATMSGKSTNALVSEFAEISNRLLERAQSAG
jgi:hypothetical protein